ncbi:hypothetical protein ACO0QE_002765 [Hanseniaspora vineae]
MNSEVQDLLDLDIDFETAYNMLGNTDMFLSSFLNASPKKTNQAESSNQNISASFETPLTAQSPINTHNMQPQVQNQHLDSASTNAYAQEKNVQNGMHSESFSLKKSPKTTNNQVSTPQPNLASFHHETAQYISHTNDNYIPTTSNPNQRQRQPSTYELLSVNESHAIESFLDSLMEGNNQKNAGIAQQHGDSNAHDQSHTSLSNDHTDIPLATSLSSNLKHEESVQPVLSENAETNDAWGMEPQHFVKNVEHDIGVDPSFQSQNDVSLASIENTREEGSTDKLGYEELSVKYEKIMDQINVQKKKHLLAEQKRRAAIKNSFEMLQNAIKYPRVDGFHAKSSKKRVKKHEYLQFVIEDIEGLIKANQELREMTESLGNSKVYGFQQ